MKKMTHATRTQYSEKRPSLAYGLPIVLFVLLGFGVMGYLTWSDWIRANFFGEPAEAVILECITIRGKLTTEKVRYRFFVPSDNGGGTVMEGEDTVRDACARFPAGEKAAVHYLASDPGISNLDAVNPLQDTFGPIAAFGFGISCTMLFLVLFGFMRFSKSKFWMKGVHDR
jgi:hypothetical protein